MTITKHYLTTVSQAELGALLNISLTTLMLWKDSSWPEEIGPFPQPIKDGQKNIYNYFTAKLWQEKYLLHTKYKEYITPSSSSVEDSEDWKKRKERAQALREEMDLAEAQKKLLPAHDVELAWSDTVLKIRAKLLTVPKRVSRLLYDGLKSSEREEIIDNEIRATLNLLEANQEEVITDGQ